MRSTSLAGSRTITGVGDYKARIGRRIARARQQRGWSQHELARRTGIPKITSQQISRWERGKHMPTSENFEALERALGVKLIPTNDD